MDVADLVTVTANDHDQQKINSRQEQRIKNKPNLAKNGIEVLFVKFRT